MSAVSKHINHANDDYSNCWRMSNGASIRYAWTHDCGSLCSLSTVQEAGYCALLGTTSNGLRAAIAEARRRKNRRLVGPVAGRVNGPTPQARLPRTIVTNADHLARSIKPLHLVQTIRNGVEAFPPAKVVSPLYRELDLPADSVFLAATGDLRSKKRLQDIVWAFDLLRVIRSNLQLLILGAGEPSSELLSFIRRAASSPGVHLLGYRDDVGSVLRQCSCLWQASEDEGCSNALLEAMVAALPVVASDVPGHRETLQAAACGTLTPLGDCAEMARRTNLLLENAMATAEKRRQAQTNVLREFSVRKMVANYCDFYAQLLTSKRTAA